MGNKTISKITLCLLTMACICAAIPPAQADNVSPKLARQAVEAVEQDKPHTATHKLLRCADRLLHRKQTGNDIKAILSSLEQLQSLLTDKMYYEGSPKKRKELMKVSAAESMLQEAVAVVSLIEQYPAD